MTFVNTNGYAQTDLAAITGSKFEPCVKDFANDFLTAELEQSGATLESFPFDRITTERYGDATAVFRMAAVAAGDQRVTVYIDLIFILKGRAEISLSFTEVSKPFDEALQRSLLAKMGAKLATV